MKKLTIKCALAALLLAVMPASAFAQEVKISGEAKTGIFWQREQLEGKDPEAEVDLHSKDDAGGGRGRFRMNLDYDNGNNFGMRFRIDLEDWRGESLGNANLKYAFGYGNFFENQMSVSVGKLGGSPWGTGGPEMWKELEQGAGGGMRVEWKPNFIPVGALNLGFVLNYFNSDRDQGSDSLDVPISLANILQESVIGVSYTHDKFLVRFAYRFDSEMDAIQDNKITGGKYEDEIVYRVEERILTDYLPGFQMWALGHLFGVSAVEEKSKSIQWFRNWLFAEYTPPEMGNFTEPFTAQIRVGYDYIESRSDFYVKPSFYWHFLNKLISAGLSFQYCQDFGDGKLFDGSPYRFIEVEPKVQINFASSYIAFAYNFKQEYMQPWPELPSGKDPLKQTQWLNLRFCIYY